MSLLLDIAKYIVDVFSKQTDVSAECEDSIQFEDKYRDFIINNSIVYIYQ